MGLPKQSTHVLFVPPQMPAVANDCRITLKPKTKIENRSKTTTAYRSSRGSFRRSARCCNQPVWEKEHRPCTATPTDPQQSTDACAPTRSLGIGCCRCRSRRTGRTPPRSARRRRTLQPSHRSRLARGSARCPRQPCRKRNAGGLQRSAACCNAACGYFGSIPLGLRHGRRVHLAPNGVLQKLSADAHAHTHTRANTHTHTRTHTHKHAHA